MNVNHHTTTAIPVDDKYAAILGKAVYIFAYYEWTIIYIIAFYESGFVAQYSRPSKSPLTSGAVNQKLKEIINGFDFPESNVTKAEIELCQQEFESLIAKRNALIHAHPATDIDGSQILVYQTKPSKPFSDMVWKESEINEIIKEIDNAGVKASAILNQIRRRS
ncbi:MAG: hypothetical protein RIF36_21150 [Imperialibacter sp.]|uniref:hypothetical protein n=1 Tax=Imperialibacter sp. TaxID=2038411 RepID=UPI0032EFCD69